MNNQISTNLMQPFIKEHSLQGIYVVVYEVGRYNQRKPIKFLITNDVDTIASYMNQRIPYHRCRICFNIVEAYDYLSSIIPEDTYPDYGIKNGYVKPNTIYYSNTHHR